MRAAGAVSFVRAVFLCWQLQLCWYMHLRMFGLPLNLPPCPVKLKDHILSVT